MNMTDEQMRIAIAEACGRMKWSYALPVRCIAASVPDYLNDLNAMHCAEKIIIEAPETPANDHRRREWRSILKRLCGYTYSEHATARQRAIAFIKTLNLEPK